MDGVLVDSEEFICNAAIEMFRGYGISANRDDFLPFIGTGENRYIGGVAEKHGLVADIEIIKEKTYDIYERLTKGRLKPLPGATEFISICMSRNLRIAIATSADKRKMDINLRETGLSELVFHAMVNGLDVERKKPFPDIYLKAAALININPADCLVVEDAVNGIRAAKAAGCKCLAVSTSFSPENLSEADWICDSMLNIPEEVLKW
jgi:HAD superfamily hydrolase (TIGR01509 family)